MTNVGPAAASFGPGTGLDPRRSRGAIVSAWLARWSRGASGRRGAAVSGPAVDLGADASVDAGALLVAAGADPAVRLAAAR